MDIPDFKNTNEALQFGKENKNNPVLFAELTQRYLNMSNEVKVLLDKDKVGEALYKGCKAQFIREALEVMV